MNRSSQVKSELDALRISVINSFGFYIYTSIIVFPLMYFYFINNKISLKEKISTSIILLILISSEALK